MSDSGAKETGAVPETPDFELPPTGTHVRTIDASGNVRTGWKLVGENPLNNLIVIMHEIPQPADLPREEHKVERKDLTRAAFIRMNPVPGIDDVDTFAKLYAALSRVSSVRGESGVYSSEGLREIIGKVQRGELDVNNVTRAGGLREKVQELKDNKTAPH